MFRGVILVCGLLLGRLCVAHNHEHAEQPANTNVTALLVCMGSTDEARLMSEAALLLAQQDFHVTLILVGPAAKLSTIPPSSPHLKVHRLDVKASLCDGTTTDVVPNHCDVEAYLRRCDVLLKNRAKLGLGPQRLVLFPGLLHDACLLPSLVTENTAVLIWSFGPVSSAWLGHATNAIPFSTARAPLQAEASSLLDRVMTAKRWSNFLNHIQSVYWQPASALVAKHLNTAPMSLEKAYKNVALWMSASHPLLETPRPALTMRVNVGCFHCRHARLLPEELQEWVTARRGGIVVSTLPRDESYRALLRAVARAMPQFAVLWLTSDTTSSTEDVAAAAEDPANLVTHSACPEQDALGHPRTRLVLSQCSEVSVLAAVFHGVPLICLPSGMDEREPAARVSQLGVGLSLPHVPHDEELLAAVSHITSNSSYRYAARHLGVMIRDEPETSADRLVFWAGHAARHWGHGHEEAMLNARLAPRDEPLGHLNIGLLLGFVCGLICALSATFAKRIISKEKSTTMQSKQKNK